MAHGTDGEPASAQTLSLAEAGRLFDNVVGRYGRMPIHRHRSDGRRMIQGDPVVQYGEDIRRTHGFLAPRSGGAVLAPSTPQLLSSEGTRSGINLLIREDVLDVNNVVQQASCFGEG